MAKRSLSSCYKKFMYFILFFAIIFGTKEANSEQEDPSTWPGHLEPLASQNVKNPVDFVEEFPKPEDFFRDFVSAGKPLLIKNGAKISPAYKLWTDEYFVNLPGAENTSVFAEKQKKENRTLGGNEISFKEFVEKYNTSDIYMVNGVPDILQKDILLPPLLLCENVKPLLVDTVMWFSSGGTKSVFHHDDVDNINCLYRGTKRLLFVDYQKYKTKLRLDNAWGGFSGVDVDKVDFTKYPIFHEVEFYEANMESGDCLFIPFKWYHQVTSTGNNLAVNIWWKHLRTSFTPKNCGKIAGSNTSLDKFYFSSLAKNGDDSGDDSADEEEGGEYSLFIKLEDDLNEKKHLSFEGFTKFLQDSIQAEEKPEFEPELLEYMGHVFQLADSDKDGDLTNTDLRKLDDKNFREFENGISELESVLAEYNDPMPDPPGEEAKQDNTRDEL